MCGALLAGKSRLRDIVLERNRRIQLSHSEPVIFFGPLQSTIYAEGIKAHENTVGIFDIEGGLLELYDSDISNNRIQEIQDASTSCVELRNAVAEIQNCEFRKNVATDGAAIGAYNSNITVNSCVFEENSAFSGGAMYIEASSLLLDEERRIEQNRADNEGGGIYSLNAVVNTTSTTVKENHAGGDGGGIYCLDSKIILTSANISGNKAAFHGGGIYVENSEVVATESTVVSNNTAGLYGGGIHTENSNITAAKTTKIERNAAGLEGGGIHSLNSTIAMNETTIVEENCAGETGGGIYGWQSNVSLTEKTRVIKNRAGRDGGGVSVSGDTDLTAQESVFEDNEAQRNGGAVAQWNSVGIFGEVSFTGNNASENGGSVFAAAAPLNITDCVFKNGNASGDGGFLSVLQSGSINITNTSMQGGGAKNGGGAIDVTSSTVRARLLNITKCSAKADGGALKAKESKILCLGCRFAENIAERNGGAISFEVHEMQNLTLQLQENNIVDNQANAAGTISLMVSDAQQIGVSPGGGLCFFSDKARTRRCTDNGTNCAFAAIIATRFKGNNALSEGGAIFTGYLKGIRFGCCSTSSCPPTSKQSNLAFYEENDWTALKLISSREDFCDEWKGNSAEKYGQTVASHAVGAQISGRPVIKGYRSGDPLPTLQVLLLDGLKQNRATILQEITATLSSNGFLGGDVGLRIQNRSADFPRLVGFGLPNTYNVTIRFDNSTFKPLTVNITVRTCTINEVPVGEHNVCTPCSSTSYNFHTSATECEPCPANGNCEKKAIVPNEGHWHSSPCSAHIQRCLTSYACKSKDRTKRLQEMSSDLKTCNMSEWSNISKWNNEAYKQKLCAEASSIRLCMESPAICHCVQGHSGPLCGSCKAGYGRSLSSKCEKCPTSFGNVLLISLSAAILLSLSAITIRGTLNAVVCRRSTLRGNGRRYPCIELSTLPPNERVEEARSQSPETDIENVREQEQEDGMPANDKVLAQWKAAEMLKVENCLPNLFSYQFCCFRSRYPTFK